MANPTTPEDRASNNNKATDPDDASGLDRSFAAALRAAETAPESEDAWDHLEDLADKLQRPDEVAAAYRSVLEKQLPADVFAVLSERAYQFHDEWFGDTPEKITGILSRIIELDNGADWAFERLSVMLTSSAQWADLLDLYDKTLAATQDKGKRRRLLNDAAQAAKDFADEPDRAADYMQQLLLLEPENEQLVTSLERLLERQERYRDLIGLWESRVSRLKGEAARNVRVQVAVCWLEKLDEPGRALDVLRELVSESPGHGEACKQLERVLELTDADLSIRQGALSLLRKNYLVAQRPEDVVRVLERALAFVEEDERRPIHRELGSRLAILGRDEDALSHYRELLIAEPTDADARKQLRQLAKKTGREDLRAAALVAAAEASSGAQRDAVLLEAAHLHRKVLNDTDRAIELYSQVLTSEDAEESVALTAAHNLSELLASAERHEERLAVLEKLATLERSAAVRRFVLGEAAELADQLGAPDRALANWRPVLDADAHDLEALGAVIDLLERNERWAELAEALGQRARAKVAPLQRRADLVRVAEVQRHHLDLGLEAIETWLSIRRDFGEDEETVSALDRLMSEVGRYQELADVLGSAARQRRDGTGTLLARLGDVHRVELDEPEVALGWYRDALAINPRGEAARTGMLALLTVGACTKEAAMRLARAYEATDDWQQTLTLLESRLATAGSRAENARLLREAATIQLERADDAEAGLTTLCRSLPLEPANLATEARIMQLAQETGRWVTAAASFRMAAESAESAPARRAQLRMAEGSIHEDHLGDPEAALIAYQAAVTAEADNSAAHEAIARCGAQLGQWSVATDAAVASVVLRDRIRAEVVRALEASAAERGEWDQLAPAMAASLASRRVDPTLAQNLEIKVMTWFKDQAGDLDAAEQAAARAVALGSGRLEALEPLAALQRRHPGPELIGTLLKIDKASEQTLDALSEAANLALALDNPPVSLRILESLYRKAGGMWMRHEIPSGEVVAPAAAQWALDQLITHHVESGSADRAVHVLMDGTRLPLGADTACELRRRAADMLIERGELGRAIDVMRGVLDERPDDMEALQLVASMCEKEGRVTEALALRLRELSLVEDVDRRLQLRLDHSRLTGALEAQGGRVASLRANLDDVPGHEASIEELSVVLDERGKHADLVDILSEQAKRLEERDELERSAHLWSRVAALAEKPLGDRDRAVAAHAHVVQLAAGTDSLDALARLHLEKNEPAEAARWLEQRLGSTAPGERVAVLLKLARARITADKRDAAIEALSIAFEEAPRNGEVRKLLLKQFRMSKDHEKLAEVLTKAALAVTDHGTVLTYAREAADIYIQRLETPDRAVPVLTKAVELAPEDRELRSMLAEGLLVSGELDRARGLLESLIQDFGRRRSPERAQAHLQLARVAHAQGEATQAIDQLETASKMDAGNVTILKTLAELARETGQHDRAERAFRTLLMSVRRETEPSLLPIGPTEVLFELSRIAADRGQDDKADELIESVLESLTQHDFEASRIQKKLALRGELELEKRVLEHRLGYVEQTAARAQIHADLAQVLEHGLDRLDDALAARLAAVNTDPSSPLHHQAALETARRADKLDTYVSVVEALLADERADTSAHVRCELLLRLGEVLEKERGDLDRAAKLYAQAESTGVRTVDVWRAQARVAGERGDADEQMRLLSHLASLGEDQAETRADAMYRIAEVQLGSDETFGEGIDSLQKALQESFRTERAALILRRVSDQHPDDEGLLDVYEQVARRSEDEKNLMHYLERRARHGSATPEQAKEAVELATKLEDHDLAEQLMLRAAEIGKGLNRADDLRRIDWALIGLTARRMEAGDLAGAVKWLSDAAEVADLEPVFELSDQIAELAAQPDGDLTLAAKLYERLLERAPTERKAWGPLADIYSRLGDTEQLERMIDETLDGLEEPRDRNALRVALARALLRIPERVEDAVGVLQEVLVDDPQETEAQALLFDHLERTGRTEELAEMLVRQLDAAQDRQDVESIKSISLRLASRVEATDRAEALEILRRALRWAPNDPDVLRTILGKLGDDDDAHERAELMEALVKVDEPANAGPAALELARLYDELNDEEGALRALKLGAERAPTHEEIRTRLQARCRERGDFAGLADSLLDASERTAEPHSKATLLREAAVVRRDHLDDPQGAAQLLMQASVELPADTELRVELARALSAAGAHERAVSTISEALEVTDSAAERLAMLLARAELRASAGDPDGSISDLEHGFDIDAAAVAPELEAALARRLDAAVAANDDAGERQTTLRTVDVMLVQGKRSEATELLGSWIGKRADDSEALRRLREMVTTDGEWQKVADTCERLIHLEEGTAQVDAALGLSHAYQELGNPDGARPGLEQVRGQQPENREVRAELRKIYEHLDDQHSLAKLLVEDAAGTEDVEERSDMLMRAGRIFVNMKDAASAVPPLREALALSPGGVAATVSLADAYILAGWFDDANTLLDEAVAAGRGRRTPEICVFHHRRAQVANALGDKPQQLDLLQEAHLCNKKNGLVAAELADLAEEVGEWDLAAKTLRTITLIDTDCPISRGQAFLRQGKIAHMQGDEKSARMWARRAKREAPDDTEVDAFLDELGERKR